MFKKQASYKPSAAIRNQERKGLVIEVKRHFSAALDNLSEEEVKTCMDVVLPPSGIESAAFTTTKGHRGVLYSHSDAPIWIRYEDKLVPTLHTLWRCPLRLTSTALTGSQVLVNLQAGSDLMVKGMFEYSPAVKQGDVVGILVSDRPHVVAVGIAARDFEGIRRDEGGKGILLVTCLGDTITPVSAYPTGQTDGPASVSPLPSLAKLSIPQDEQEGDGLSSAAAAMVAPADGGADKADNQDWPDLSTDDIDEAFRQALIYGITELSTHQADAGLPMPASTLIDTHVLPFLPSLHPDLVLKKTSCAFSHLVVPWKKDRSIADMLVNREEGQQVSLKAEIPQVQGAQGPSVHHRHRLVLGPLKGLFTLHTPHLVSHWLKD